MRHSAVEYRNGPSRDRPKPAAASTCVAQGNKRAIIAAWASDACAVEAAPKLRTGPGTVLFDEIFSPQDHQQNDQADRHARSERIRPPCT